MWWTLIVLAFIFWVVAFTHHIGGLASGMLLATWIVLAVARIIDMTRTRTPRIGG